MLLSGGTASQKQRHECGGGLDLTGAHASEGGAASKGGEMSASLLMCRESKPSGMSVVGAIHLHRGQHISL